MLLAQQNGYGTYDVLMDGYISRGYKTERQNGIVQTHFTFCYDVFYDRITREKTYFNAIVTVYEEHYAQMVASAKRDNRSVLLVFGTTETDPRECERKKAFPRVRASSLFPITDFIKMRDYMLGAVKYDSAIQKATEIRYDYETESSESDHMI